MIVYRREDWASCHVVGVRLGVRNVLICACISVLLRETKIDEVDDICLGPCADENIAGFKVAVDEATGVDVLQPTKLNVISLQLVTLTSK